MHTFFIAPTGFGVGLTSISLGLVGALERSGLKVGFFKPIAQPHAGDLGPERSSELIARTHGLHSPKPLPLSHVERMLGEGQLDEALVALYTDAFTEAELKELLAFYQTPVGRKVLEQMPQLMAHSAQLTQARLQQVVPEVDRLLGAMTSELKPAKP